MELKIKRHKNIFIMFSIITLLIFTFSCKTSSDVGNNGGNGMETPPNTITIEGSRFVPATITVQAGTTVTWVHRDSVVHTATSGTRGNVDGVFNSGDMNNGDSFQFTFSNPGTFNYHCIYHLGMDGVVNVQ